MTEGKKGKVIDSGYFELVRRGIDNFELEGSICVQNVYTVVDVGPFRGEIITLNAT